MVARRQANRKAVHNSPNREDLLPMRRPSPLHRSLFPDLAAFALTLVTGVTLIALGLSPESLAAVAIALAGLYSAWRTGRSPVSPTHEADSHPEGVHIQGTEEAPVRSKGKTAEKEDAR
ncbi:hypothetical protein [Streptomyces goshikiensis]|uniref:hypothetical protein n=1 Tax=Streptomyces goshikiensis TaxID=1942 RepID=UPI0036676CCF